MATGNWERQIPALSKVLLVRKVLPVRKVRPGHKARPAIQELLARPDRQAHKVILVLPDLKAIPGQLARLAQPAPASSRAPFFTCPPPRSRPRASLRSAPA